jgi:hypothetical protein
MQLEVKRIRGDDFKSDDTIATFVKYKDSAKSKYDRVRKEAYNAHPSNVTIRSYRTIISNSVNKCHLISRTFQSAYTTILYPKFAANKSMVKKKASGELPGEWKSTLQYLAHARHRIKLVRLVGIMGKCIVGPSEACSTMLCPFCMTLASPGMHWVHHCPNTECQKAALRDDCGRGIALLTDVKVAMRYGGGRNAAAGGEGSNDQLQQDGSNGFNPTNVSSGLR